VLVPLTQINSSSSKSIIRSTAVYLRVKIGKQQQQLCLLDKGCDATDYQKVSHPRLSPITCRKDCFLEYRKMWARKLVFLRGHFRISWIACTHWQPATDTQGSVNHSLNTGTPGLVAYCWKHQCFDDSNSVNTMNLNKMDCFEYCCLSQEHRKTSQITQTKNKFILQLAATLRGSRPGVQSASLIMTSLMTS